MYQSRSNSLHAAIASTQKALPTVVLQSFAVAGAGLARVLVEVTHNAASRADPSLISQSLKQLVGGKLEAVAGSFVSLDKGSYTERIAGVMSVVREAIPVTPESTKLFRATASNMFMDDEKDMWVLRKTEAGQLYVKTTGIDDDMSLIGMLDACASAGFRNHPDHARMVAQCSALASAVEGGDFVTYVNFDNSLSCGFVVAGSNDESVAILPIGADDVEQVNKAAVVTIHPQDEFPSMKQNGEEEAGTVVAAARGGIDINFLLDYYKKVYARSPKFYEQFAQRLQSHFA